MQTKEDFVENGVSAPGVAIRGSILYECRKVVVKKTKQIIRGRHSNRFSRWQPRQLITTSGFVSIDIAIIGILFCIGVPNFIRIRQATAELWWHTDFQDVCHSGTIPVSDWVMSLSWEGQKVYPQTKFHRDNSIHSWDITTSSLEKQMSTILVFYLWIRFRYG